MTMTNGVGTPFYMAPEMATGSSHYTAAVDVYSFGIMAAQTMAGRLTYDSDVDFNTQYGLLFSPCFESKKNSFITFCHLYTNSLCKCCL